MGGEDFSENSDQFTFLKFKNRPVLQKLTKSCNIQNNHRFRFLTINYLWETIKLYEPSQTIWGRK